MISCSGSLGFPLFVLGIGTLVVQFLLVVKLKSARDSHCDCLPDSQLFK